ARIVMIPTSAEDPIPETPVEVRLLKLHGAKNVQVLHTRKRAEALDPKFSELFLKAGGVWFGGGRQWRFVDSYEGTPVVEGCFGVLARGGVIGGSSSGASIQAEYMPRGHPLGNTVMCAEGYEQGFGFLPGVAIDQHFFARKRVDDMKELMAKYPQYLGIGIDEGTAIVVQGPNAEVIGRSKVGFFTPKMEEVPAGKIYDLVARRVKP
ncbi:MAG: cyanophycinase, partial [Gemmataceae bacterium]